MWSQGNMWTSGAQQKTARGLRLRALGHRWPEYLHSRAGSLLFPLQCVLVFFLHLVNETHSFAIFVQPEMKMRGRTDPDEPCNVNRDKEVEAVTKLDRLYP